jgi:hypothetical protein
MPTCVLFPFASVDWLTRCAAVYHDRPRSTAAISPKGAASFTRPKGTVVALFNGMSLQTIAPPLSNVVQLTDLSARIRGEYREMPGLRLTLSQASRLWNVDRDLCIRALESLTQTGFLYRSGEAYLKRGES